MYFEFDALNDQTLKIQTSFFANVESQRCVQFTGFVSYT